MADKRQETIIRAVIDDHRKMLDDLYAFQLEAIVKFGAMLRQALYNSNTIFFMGNGGSAADSQHLAAEFVGRFQKERRGLPAVALTTDTSILTAVGNDYGFENVFARQVEALVRPGDVVVGLSTSGNSPNVLKAFAAARAIGAVTIGMSGRSGGKMADACDLCLKMPADVTARVQEGHAMVGHIVCQLVDEEVAGV